MRTHSKAENRIILFLSRSGRIAQERDRLGPFVREDHVPHAVLVEIEDGNGPGVEHLLIKADRFAGVLELPAADISEVAVRAVQAADEKVELPAVVEVRPRGADRVADRLVQVARQPGAIQEASLPRVPEELRSALLRDEEVRLSIA